MQNLPFQNILCYGLSSQQTQQTAAPQLFQNILCYGLSNYWKTDSPSVVNFKTSYVMVYLYLPILATFIDCDFKTSYVMVYLIVSPSGRPSICYFKTSYVMVYRFSPPAFASLFAISKHLMLWFIRNEKGKMFRKYLFQNILCYGLSGILRGKIFTLLSFQNILCYGLSVAEAKGYRDAAAFQNILCYGLSQRTICQCSACHISKHLMLWFIPFAHKQAVSLILFQNILCYGLSLLESLSRCPFLISKHLMLWFIWISLDGTEPHHRISKHLMLWFIPAGNPAVPVCPSFQNILCYGLSLSDVKFDLQYWNFKTSYVMVYLLREERAKKPVM